MTPIVGYRAFWLTIILSVITLAVWVLSSIFGWDPGAPYATISILGGAFGVGKVGEWVGRGIGARGTEEDPAELEYGEEEDEDEDEE